jgi:hypothetical protein
LGENRVKVDMPVPDIKNVTIPPEILKLIADSDEFKGRWKVIETLVSRKTDQPAADCHVKASVSKTLHLLSRQESIGSWRPTAIFRQPSVGLP